MLVGSIGTTHALSSPLTDESLISLLLSEPLWAASAAHRHIIEYCFAIVTVLQINNIYSQTHWGLSSQQNKQEIKAAAGTFAANWIFIFTSDCRSDILMTLVLLFWLGVWVSWCINDAESFCRRVCSSRVCLCFVFHCIRFEMRLRWRGQTADS